MPYAPGESYNFTPLFEGIRSFGNNVHQFVERRRDEGRKATALRRVYEAYAPEELKGSSAGMGLADLEGAVQAFALTQARNDRAADVDLRRRGVVAQEGHLNLAKTAQEAGLEDRRRAGAFQTRLAELVQGGPLSSGFREPGNLSLTDVVAAAGESGMTMPMGSLLDAVRAMRSEAEAPPPKAFEVGGLSGIYSPKTGAMVPLPKDELTPAQRQAYARMLQQEWIKLARDMADPTKQAGLAGLQAAKEMLEQQFADFGLKVPEAPQPEPEKTPPPNKKPKSLWDRFRPLDK